MRDKGRYRARANGFTYLLVLFSVALIAAGLAAVAEVWRTAAIREKEAELIFVGNEFRQAIGRYYQRYSSTGEPFPKTLEVLLEDPRQPFTARYLRKIYRDPMTGTTEWGLVKTPSGGIVGVYSLALGAPVKRANFPGESAQFAGALSYADWRFIYQPVNAVPVAAGPAAPANPNALPPSVAAARAARNAALAAETAASPVPDCTQVTRYDASVCAQEAKDNGEAEDCFASARARAGACDRGENLPPLVFRYGN